MHPNKIVVVGGGTVGVPLAALLASSGGTDGSLPPRVVVVQRGSPTSGWKVDTLNSGRTPDAAAEPALAGLVASAVARGTLSATHDIGVCRDADAIVVCVQTDVIGLAPDYGPLISALDGIASAVRERPAMTRPLVIVESTLAPSTMACVVRQRFERVGLLDGRDVLLGYAPARDSQKGAIEGARRASRLVAGLHPEAPVLVASLYRRIVRQGRVLVTGSLTAEVVRTAESADRDVRAAFSTEIARHCDRLDVDYGTLRDQVNDLLAWPDEWAPGDESAEGALLAPAVGVGGTSLPRDGILLWWRALEAGHPSRNSLMLAARGVNDASPAATVRLARMHLGAMTGRRVAVLGAAYRAGTADTRHSPALVLANLLRDSGADVHVHDPLVPGHDVHLERLGFSDRFSNELGAVLHGSDVVVVATGHPEYRELLPRLRAHSSGIPGVVDACGLFHPADFDGLPVRYAGIGRGRRAPERTLVRSVASMYRAVARGMANEIEDLVRFLNARFASDGFTRAEFDDVRRLAATAPSGCRLDSPGDVERVDTHDGFVSGLAQLAMDASLARKPDPRRVPPAPVPPGVWFGNEEGIVSGETPWPLTPRQ